MRTPRIPALLAASFLSAPAVAQVPAEVPEPREAPQVREAPQARPRAQAVSTEQVLKRMYAMNRLQVRLGELAEERATHPDVRDLGDRLAGDHRLAMRRVRSLADDLEIELEDPNLMQDPMLRQMNQMASRLEAAQGAAFTSMYLDLSVQMRQKMIDMLTAARGQVDSEETAELIEDLVPILDQQQRLAGVVQADVDVRQAAAGD